MKKNNNTQDNTIRNLKVLQKLKIILLVKKLIQK
jgi:hypothetical protein